ncbi:MAG TPA: F0F1 ATP synthase subunit delta [Usitatibacter sp.]|nr:F0F1 ATP synthase subunit delta [Usitatibacter sp.]
MQLDWSTVALEVVNFLVLVWLLKRFLYRPILDVVAARQAAIDRATSGARETEARARELEQKYEGRLRDWDQERAQARAALQEELRDERRKALAAQEASLAEAREKARVLDERRRAEAAGRLEREALAQAAEFARRLLAKLASPDLEARLAASAAEAIGAMDDERRARLRAALQGSAEPGTVTTAFPLAPSQREALARALEGATGQAREWIFREDSSLLAGVRVSIGPWILHFNLGEELELFAADAADGR